MLRRYLSALTGVPPHAAEPDSGSYRFRYSSIRVVIDLGSYRFR